MKIVSHECHSYCEICGKDLNERVRELEAERDRLKAELEYQKTIEEQMDVINEGLRASHAALVEKAKHAYSEWEGGSHREAIAAMEELKAALAEVK